MPPKTRVRRVGAGTRGGRGVPSAQNQFARDLVAALTAANLLNQAPRENVEDRAMVAMREFSRRNPPVFDGTSSDPLVADHWLAQIRKLFRALNITEDTIRVGIVVVQLVGEAGEWWESVLESRKDTRRAARTATQVDEPDVENLTWVEFEALFEEQYFPETSREQLRDQFEKLEQGSMIVSEYAQKFQSLSRFAPELVATKERKCRRFEKGLHNTVRRMVMVQRKTKYAEVVECARSIEIPKEAQRNKGVWEPRQSTVSTSSSSGSFGSQGRKRAREPSQIPQGSSSNFRSQSSSLGTRGALSKPPIVCYKCNQPGHVRVQYPHIDKTCFVCGKADHLARSYPQGSGARSESGFVQQLGTGCNVGQPFRGTQRQQQPYFRQTTLVQSSGVDKGASSSAPAQGSGQRGGFMQGQGNQGRVFNITSAIPHTTSQAPETSVMRGGRTPLDRICRDCELIIRDRRFMFDFVVLGMSGFDLILGMDWLSTFPAAIDCFKPRVCICPPEGPCFEFFGERREPLESYFVGLVS
ncbi:uncharacterized protein LOC131327951 [Rhododendron vialii]|uniref:uncharacterized protein LOC131327951 n=1 Tax=Rhododendron vialii TaxID=182163 RepID=UPI00265E8F05|nr:uncharacterized protein LOC131327951 [Rhododendron vialii]